MSQVASDFCKFFLIFIWSTNYIFLTGIFLCASAYVCVSECVCECVGACEKEKIIWWFFLTHIDTHPHPHLHTLAYTLTHTHTLLTHIHLFLYLVNLLHFFDRLFSWFLICTWPGDFDRLFSKPLF